jgi:hypothetical protein
MRKGTKKVLGARVMRIIYMAFNFRIQGKAWPAGTR